MKFKILIRYAVDLISAIADHLKFNFTFKWVDDGNYGSKKEDSNEWNGMIGELKSGVRKIFLLGIFWNGFLSSNALHCNVNIFLGYLIFDILG